MAKSIYEIHNLENNPLPIILLEICASGRSHATSNWHENIEFLYCTKGCGCVYCDSERYDFLPDTMIIANTNVIHNIYGLPEITYYCLIIDSTFCRKSGIDITKIKFKETIKDKKFLAMLEEIKTAHDTFYENGKIYSIAELQIKILSLLTYLCKEYLEEISADKTMSNTSADRIKEALIYIRENFAENITLDSIANHLKISKYHLSREFKSFTGNTIFETLNSVRCKEAKRLISNGSQVSEAANLCGFENLSYFTRCFKKLYGVLPSKYLKRKQE